MRLLTVLLFVVFAIGSITQAQSSQDILRHGIMDSVNIQSDEQLLVDLRKYLSLDKTEVEKRKKAGESSLSLVFAKLLTLGLGSDEESEELKQLREILVQKDSLVIQHTRFTNIKLRLVNSNIVNRWAEVRCKEIEEDGQRGVALKQVGLSQTPGQNSREFALTLSYAPAYTKAPQKLTITGVTVVGAVYKDALAFKEGATVAALTGITQKFERKGNGSGLVVIDFAETKSAQFQWLPDVPAPKPAPEPKPVPDVPTDYINSVHVHFDTDRTKVQEGKVTLSVFVANVEVARVEHVEQKCGGPKFEDSGNRPQGYGYTMTIAPKVPYKVGAEVEVRLEHVGVGKEVDWGGWMSAVVLTDKRSTDGISLGKSPHFFFKNASDRENQGAGKVSLKIKLP